MPTEPLKDLSTEKYAEAIIDWFGPLAKPALAVLKDTTRPESVVETLRSDAAKDRFRHLLEWAPALRTTLAPVIVPILSEDYSATEDLADLPLDSRPTSVASAYVNQRTIALARWALGEDIDLHSSLTELSEALLNHLHRRLQLSFSIVALGSLASADLAPNSNLNLLLVADSADSARNDLEAHALFGFFKGLHHYGLPVEVDIQRIHDHLYMAPGGLSGLAISSLSPAEYVSLSLLRPLIGDPERTIEPTPLTPERLRKLMAHKKRMETELVAPRYRRRNVKFGEGGLSDILWLLMVHEGRYPTATDRGRPGPLSGGQPLWRTEERLGKLASAQLLTFIETDELKEAHRHLQRVRTWLHLLDLHPDVIPENPDKLLRLAKAMGFEEGNDFLRHHEDHLDAVRSIYLDSMERLRA